MAKLEKQKTLKSWIKYDNETHFPIQNIPFGVFQKTNDDIRIGTRIGDYVLDLYEISKSGYFNHSKYLNNGKCFLNSTLNELMSYEREAWREARSMIQYLFEENSKYLRDNKNLQKNSLYKYTDVKMVLPASIGDYTDFYSSKNHATNVGIMFRGKDNALQPNWLWIPIGYHGRASSIVVSDTPIRRPLGQLKADENDKNPPVLEPCKLLDFELELAFFIGGKLPKMGNPIAIQDTDKHIFGVVLMNDWSARDIQKWEYVPLGPFNAKNFATTISPWIISMDALSEFKITPEKQNPKPLLYLQHPEHHVFDINLKVSIQSLKMKEPLIISKSNAKYLYWSFHQQLAHHSISGCPFNSGDLCGSGTISGIEKSELGSMLEITWRGANPIKLTDGTERKFLQDGDKVIMTGYAQHKKDNYRVGFGECNGIILPAHDFNKIIKGKL